jgi:hypothetical protein
MHKEIFMNYLHKQDAWSIRTDGSFAQAINDYMISDGMPEEGVAKIVQNAAKILSYCPNPKNNIAVSKTGLVIGKVQSGKTSNFIALTALAFDNNYDLIVVLGGTKKPLVTQNRERISEYFKQVEGDVCILDTVTYRDKINEEEILKYITMGKKIIIVALKNSKQISFIKNNLFCDSVFSEKATLIIDDEGDEASLNTLVPKGKKSATYKAILELKDNLKSHCYISVTATPQANILIPALDVLSPDYGVLVDPGEGYCGLDTFHGSETKYTIPIKDKTSLLDEGIPESFSKALTLFFVGCAIRKFKGMKSGDKFSMLVHPSHMKTDHNLVFSKATNLIKNWKAISVNKSDIAYADLKSKLEAAFNLYRKDGVLMPEFQEIECEIIKAINFAGIHIINGDQVANNADKFYDFNIYIGGNMLGRGLTLKGLAITYIIRTAQGVSSVDTVQQRARWFGYKTKYLELCRIFASEKIIREFRAIRDHEEDLWETVGAANLQGTKFKDLSRIFTLTDDMRMTSGNKAQTTNYSFSLWNLEREFQSIPEYINSNNFTLKTLREGHAESLTTKRIGEGAPYVILEGLSFKQIKTELLDKFRFASDSKFSKGLFDKLNILFDKKAVNAVIDVIWMRDGITSDHTVTDNRIAEYMVGRRPQNLSLPATYKGDRYEFIKSDCMQLQVHTIKDKNTGIVSPTFALYLPETYIEKLTNLVIRS